MDARDWRFPMTCPSCAALAGRPHRVSADHKTLSLDVRCLECRHEWPISAPSPTVCLVAKPDRRSQPRAVRVPERWSS